MDTTKFKTRTIVKARDNGDSGSKWCIALDVGYSAVKVFSPNFIALFPSYAKKEESNFLGEIASDVILYKNLITGESWTVGESAQERIDSRDTDESETTLYGRERYATPMFKVLVEAGMGIGALPSRTNAVGDREIFVQTGLPPKYLKMDKDSLSDVIEGRHYFSLKLGPNAERVFDFTIKRENIHVMYQPMGTLYSVMKNADRVSVPNAADYINKNTLVFDPGFGTLDIFPIRKGRMEKSETFDNLGMKRVLAETADVINRKYNQDITVQSMQKFLARGTFRLVTKENGRKVTQDVPFGDILAEKNRAVCIEALQKLEQAFPLEEYDHLIITGGTSAAWNDIIREYFAGMSTLKIICGNATDQLPFVFANVRGYYMFRHESLRGQ